MDRLPVRKIDLPVAPARPLLVLFGKMGMEGPVALWTDCGGKRMIVGLRVVADDLHLFLDEPISGGRHEAGTAAEIVFVVAIKMVPAGVDDDDVVRPDRLARRLFQIIVGDGLPFLFRQGDDDAGAEEMRERHFVDERRSLHDMRRRVDVRGVVHRGGDALREHAGLGHVMNAFDLDVFEIWPIWRLKTETMRQAVEPQTHRIVEIALKFDAANFHQMYPSRRRIIAGPVSPFSEGLPVLIHDAIHVYHYVVNS